MLRNAFIAFEGYVSGTGSVQTNPMHNFLLAKADQIVFQVVADNVTGTGPTITVQLQHSSDGRNWVNKNGTPEINGLSIPGSSTPVGSDAGTTPMLSQARLQFNLGGTTPAAYVRIYVAQRDRR